MKISLIHPSRGRAKIAKSVYDNWMAKADKPDEIQYVLSLDATDSEAGRYMGVFGLDDHWTGNPAINTIYKDNLWATVQHNKSAIEAINVAVQFATGDLFIIVSDDFDCPKNWDTELLKYLKGKSDFVVKTYDGLQPWIMTLPIMDRVYYNRFGYIYHPSYAHMFSDTEMTAVGDLLDKTIIVPMLFQHKHYSQKGGIKKDAISQKNDSTWAQGERLYLDRIKRNFDLPAEQIKGVIRCDNAHAQWLASKGIKFEYV